MDLINKKLSMKKTLIVGSKTLISREELEKHIRSTSRDNVVEEIVRWLNN